jgi:hypothetical protein
MFIITASTDNKNINHILENLPVCGEHIHLDEGYDFRVDYIEVVDDEYIISNSNYVIRVKNIV